MGDNLAPEGLPVFEDCVAWEEAQSRLETFGLSDGLPQVPPTARRLEAMMAGVDDPHRSVAALPPLLGSLSAAAVGYQCVLAGCRPAELPLVFEAARACAEPDFNLLGVLTTTGSAAIAVVVHGPIAERLDVSSSTNCLGPGVRANACIGRALSLVMRNVAGAKANVGDMATLGQPGKYTFCFAEREDSGFPSFAQRAGSRGSSSS